MKLLKSYSQIPIPFLRIPTSAADATAVNPKEIKTVLTSGLITFFNSGNPVFSDGPSNLPKNSPHWIIFEIWALESYKSVDILLLNALLSFVFCLFVNNN